MQSRNFKRYQVLGNPATNVERLSDWASDELIYLDISRDSSYDLKRDDLGVNYLHNFLEILLDVGKRCFMPLTVGGGIRTLEHAFARLNRGADKIAINTQALARPEFITEGALEFGAQCMVISIDAKERAGGGWEVYTSGGTVPTGRAPAEWAKEAQERGAGEILLNSIDRDGSAQGYDIALLQSVASSVTIPTIALGGVGEWQHFTQALDRTPVSAVAAANIFNYTENSVFKAKSFLYGAGYNFRKPHLGLSEIKVG